MEERHHTSLRQERHPRSQVPIRKNEAAFKAHNDRRKAFEERAVGSGEPIPFACECGDPECWEPIELTIAEVEAAHAKPRRYAVRPGHVTPGHVSVVEEHATHWVVATRAQPGP